MCVWVRITILSVTLIRLIHKTQWEEANLRIGRFWVPNTFPRPYLNFEHISLVVRSKWSFLEKTLYIWFLGHCKTRRRLPVVYTTKLECANNLQGSRSPGATSASNRQWRICRKRTPNHRPLWQTPLSCLPAAYKLALTNYCSASNYRWSRKRITWERRRSALPSKVCSPPATAYESRAHH